MWDERYAGDRFVFGTEPNDFLAAQYTVFRPGSRILSLGEGEGRNAVFLARQGFSVTGVDASRIGLEKALKLAAEYGVQITVDVGNLADMPFDGPYDGVVSIFCHLPRETRQHIHRKAQSALTPGGLFLLELYRPEQLQYGTGGPPTVDMLVTLDDLVSDFEGMELLFGQHIDRDVHEGVLHTGRSAVVQAIFQKPL
ncbi:MAG: class I SAM-dependent methyltransferase [Myxococcales bacterium]|nr:class I SAM-dependent methyltransferase [Myxococcales bacterium]